MHIGKRIKDRRQELGWSQRELSERMGYNNHSTITRIESGKVDIPQSKVVKFSEVLGVSIAYLMGWEEEIKKDPKGTAERHFEILMDEDFTGMFDDFRNLDLNQKRLIRDLVHNMAHSEQ